MSRAVVRMVTTQTEKYVTYEVFVGGERKWIRTVFFRNDKRHRAGGAAFREAAAGQEAETKRLAGEYS